MYTKIMWLQPHIWWLKVDNHKGPIESASTLVRMVWQTRCGATADGKIVESGRIAA